MKFTIATAVLLVLFGATASAYARQEKSQEQHGQEQKAKPAEQKDRPAQQNQHQQPQQHEAQAAAHQETKNAKPAEQQRTQRAAHTEEPQTHASNQNDAQQGNTGRRQEQAPQKHAVAENRGGSQHGRISDAHYASSFGSGHRFHVNRGEYASKRFAYGGYSFGFVDPWPVAWGYSDDVYVVYSGGGYYMCDYVHPGVRISINIL
jgi:hypothetical protein